MSETQADSTMDTAVESRRYGSMSEIMAANKALGETWFVPSVMGFFRTRIESGVLKGRYFITSEQFGDEPRLYSIRRAADDGAIETVAQRCESIRDAKDHIPREE